MPTSFTFAIVTDSHIRPESESSHGDYPSNRLANGRNRFVIEQLNQLAPDLVIHLGDFVHPIPGMPAFQPANQLARQMFAELDAPLRAIPGNHDIGDKVNAWVPAPAVTEISHQAFERFWGPTYSAFDHHGRHFVLINAPVLNSGLALEAEQRAWLEADLAANHETGNPVYLFTHYPLYLTELDEPEHYDNIGRPARDWLLSLLKQYQVEAVFAGHVHNFFCNRYGDTDLYVLPSVTFVRPGYSELFDVEPAAEFGRDDAAKLGYCLVHLREKGHHFQLVRTYGATDQPADKDSASPLRLLPDDVSLVSRLPWHEEQSGLAESSRPSIGFYLRQGWAQSVTTSHANLDEFTRKSLRNDYLLWALWDLGVRDLRLPLFDLAGETTRGRMRLMHRQGFRFTLFSVGPPDDQTAALLTEHHSLLAAWELIAPMEMIPAAVGRVRQLKETGLSLPVYLSKLDTLDDQPEWQQAGEFDHFPATGFRPTQPDLMAKCLREFGAAGVIDGFVVRLEEPLRPWRGIGGAALIADTFDLNVAIHFRPGRASEGSKFTDDLAVANFVAETLAAAAAPSGMELSHGGVEGIGQSVRVFLDTFVDHDRGYFPRHALLDRRYNPRPAFHVYRHLAAALAGQRELRMREIGASQGTDAFVLESAQSLSFLLLSTGDPPSRRLALDWSLPDAALHGRATWLDLHSGRATELEWRRSTSLDEFMVLSPPNIAASRFPVLLIFRAGME
jgi:predicted phosphodiesterase